MPGWWTILATGALLLAMVLYVRAGIPRAEPVALAVPVHGRWMVLNSATTRVPSHRINARSNGVTASAARAALNRLDESGALLPARIGRRRDREWISDELF